MIRLQWVLLFFIGSCIAVADPHPLHGQQPATPVPLEWQPSVGPFTGNALAFAEAESGTLFAYVNSEIHRSRDDGVSWTRCESQPSNRPGDLVFKRWLLTSGPRLYASAASGGPLYVTDDECASSRPIPKPPNTDYRPGHITVVDGVLVGVYGPTLFTSSDEGRTWQQGQSPLPDGIEPHLTTRNGAVFLVLSQQLFHSKDHGRTWTRLAVNGPRFSWVVAGGDKVYATASGGIWRSTDDGATWTRLFESELTSVTARGSRVYASVFNPAATVRSVDDGNTWTREAPPLRIHSSNALLETRRGALLAATGAGIYRSTDGGSRWTAAGTVGQPVLGLVAARGRAYASVDDASLWVSADSGLTWSRVDWSRVDNRRFESANPFSSLLIVTGTELRGATSREFLASRDAGLTWSAAGLSKGVNALVRLRDSWFAGTWEGGVFRSDDLAHWTECSSGLPTGSISTLSATPGGDLLAVDGSTLYRSQDDCRSWSPLSLLPFRGRGGFPARPIVVSDSMIGVVLLGANVAQLSLAERKWNIPAESRGDITGFATDDRGRYWLGTRGGVVRLSIDGSEWRLTPAGLDGDVSAVAVDSDGYLLAAVSGRGIFRARLP